MSVEPQTPPGKPITAYDERLVRVMHRDPDSWPIPALLAEIDRLRAIETAARHLHEHIVEGMESGTHLPGDLCVRQLRYALREPA